MPQCRESKEKRKPNPAQWLGLKALIRGVRVGGRKRKQKKKAQGKQQRINIRRLIRKGGLEGIAGGLEGIKKW